MYGAGDMRSNGWWSGALRRRREAGGRGEGRQVSASSPVTPIR